jgi:hypothetical protein
MARRPAFWIIVALAIFVVYNAPTDVSDILRALAHVIVALVHGFGTFLRKLG